MIGWLKVEEASAVAEARRRARRTASALGFNSTKVEHVAIVATEIAQNILRHGGGGQMLVAVFGAPSLERLHLLGFDKGPGITRVDRMVRDGETTKRSLGTGLGAILRLSDRTDIDTSPAGTVIAAEFLRQTIRSTHPADHAGFRMAYPGERRCGDGIAVRSGDGVCLYLVCDGLGHGPKAAQAADKAKQTFLAAEGSDPSHLLDEVADGLVGTRGAVAAIVALNHTEKRLDYAAVGNISTLLWQDRKLQRLSVRDGLLGARKATPHRETVALSEDAVVLMHSDGLATMHGLNEKVALMNRSAPVIAARLFGEAERKRDDASIIVARLNAGRTL
ncbi:SpoIIE family protein phosphatase [Aurantiacibacter poecillastricola]|uniref:SpoIIE family protein phosphatase n=1 Tax=Aurantiacibacter poecillastricola TaxID=3064385 RepID=UPI00273D1068|nr:SpoIIE family protein phosphatase [Aurantiacibacter sp. 219JJ12-13]MDP5261287.1 SpoIIE family protein phosphatase [Aurantiacibacter sp. 219JJ12-13]